MKKKSIFTKRNWKFWKKMKQELQIDFTNEEAVKIADYLFIEIKAVYEDLVQNSPLSTDTTTNDVYTQANDMINNMHRNAISKFFGFLNRFFTPTQVDKIYNNQYKEMMKLKEGMNAKKINLFYNHFKIALSIVMGKKQLNPTFKTNIPYYPSTTPDGFSEHSQRRNGKRTSI